MQELNRQDKGIKSNRILSMFLDHALMTIVMLVVLSPWMIGFSNYVGEADPSLPLFYLPDYAIILWAIGGGLYLNKDIRRGQSFAKQMFGFRVVDDRTGRAAGPMRLMLRNLTAIIFPVEIAMLMLNPSKRLGDYLASTRVVFSESGEEFPGSDLLPSLFSLFFAVLITFGITFGAATVLKEALRPEYIRSSYNREMSERLTSLVSPELAAGISEATFDVFDSTYSGEGGYIQGIVGVISGSFLEEDGGFPALENSVMKTVREEAGGRPCRVAVRYFRAADPNEPGIMKQYQFP